MNARVTEWIVTAVESLVLIFTVLVLVAAVFFGIDSIYRIILMASYYWAENYDPIVMLVGRVAFDLVMVSACGIIIAVIAAIIEWPDY